MSYTITASPLGGTERLLVTQDARAIALAKSLQGRPVIAHNGFFLGAHNARIWTALYQNNVTAVRRSYGWVYRYEMERYTSLANVMNRLSSRGLIRRVA